MGFRSDNAIIIDWTARSIDPAQTGARRLSMPTIDLTDAEHAQRMGVVAFAEVARRRDLARELAKATEGAFEVVGVERDREVAQRNIKVGGG